MPVPFVPAFRRKRDSGGLEGVGRPCPLPACFLGWACSLFPSNWRSWSYALTPTGPWTTIPSLPGIGPLLDKHHRESGGMERSFPSAGASITVASVRVATWQTQLHRILWLQDFCARSNKERVPGPCFCSMMVAIKSVSEEVVLTQLAGLSKCPMRAHLPSAGTVARGVISSRGRDAPHRRLLIPPLPTSSTTTSPSAAMDVSL